MYAMRGTSCEEFFTKNCAATASRGADTGRLGGDRSESAGSFLTVPSAEEQSPGRHATCVRRHHAKARAYSVANCRKLVAGRPVMRATASETAVP